jgi:hypothetical protein
VPLKNYNIEVFKNYRTGNQDSYLNHAKVKTVSRLHGIQMQTYETIPFRDGGIVDRPASAAETGIADVIRKYRREALMD